MKMIILDRDGVINYDSDDYIKSVDEFVPIPGSLEAIARLNRAGYHVYVATNQSGIARGYYQEADLQQMHNKLSTLLAEHDGHVDGIFFCPHGPDEGCDCRKPLPGLLERIAHVTGQPLQGVTVVGDSLRDLQAARAVGARPCLVKTGKGERTLARGEGLDDVPIFADLAACVDDLLSRETRQ